MEYMYVMKIFVGNNCYIIKYDILLEFNINIFVDNIKSCLFNKYFV